MKHLYKRGLRKCFFCTKVGPIEDFVVASGKSRGYDYVHKICDRARKLLRKNKHLSKAEVLNYVRLKVKLGL